MTNFLKNHSYFDIIFLDGLHNYEQTIKDINNALKFLNEKGAIIVHDCLPKKIWNQIVLEFMVIGMEMFGKLLFKLELIMM